MTDRLDLRSGAARRLLLETEMMTSAAEIEESYSLLRRYRRLLETAEPSRLSTLRFRLGGLKEIRTTLYNLSHGSLLDDIELFEVKHLALLADEVARLMEELGMADAARIPDTGEVIRILDPDGMRMASFYIYDSYSDRLRAMRESLRRQPERSEELIPEIEAVEEEIREELSRRLAPFAQRLEEAERAVALTDIRLAKAEQMAAEGLTFPTLSPDGATRYEGLFHPLVREALRSSGKTYQPVTIAFGGTPTLITGANMGGKTVVLKALTLCQYLFQFAFGIPAAAAEIAVKEEIRFCIGDDQSVERGLSSFAAEMKNIDAVIQASRRGTSLLALIDEPARTTNPAEGAALVAALVRLLSPAAETDLVMTTHYDIEPGEARCLRVKGFEEGKMNYALEEVRDGEAPREALRIAESLGIDDEWIRTARRLLATRVQNKHA